MRARIDGFDAEIADEIERALLEASSGAGVSAEQLFAHVYAQPPSRFERQRADRTRGLR